MPAASLPLPQPRTAVAPLPSPVTPVPHLGGLPPPRPSGGALPAPRPASHALRETHGDESSPIEGYQIFEKLGEGSMGMVYHARSTETGEACVLKTVKFDGSAKDAIFFIREAQMGSKLRHPNIVQVIDFGEAGG